MYNQKRESVFWGVWVFVMFLLVFWIDLSGQTISVNFSDVAPTQKIVPGNVQLDVRVSLQSDGSNSVLANNSVLPTDSPVYFRLSPIENVAEVHYWLRSNAAIVQQKTISPFNADPITITTIGPNAIIVRYWRVGDREGGIESSRLEIPFEADSFSNSPASVTRVLDTLTIVCGQKKLALTTQLSITFPITIGASTVICLLEPVTGGTNVSCSQNEIPCFTPVKVLVP